MGRPPLVLGTWGSINRKQLGPKQWVAYARFRDYDGVTRQVERQGSTGRKAEDKLKEALVERSTVYGDDITADTRMKVVAEKWFTDEIEGNRAYNTERRYREVLDLMILPGIGMVTIREMTVARCDRFVKGITSSRGPGAAKHARTVLTGVLGLAARMGALDANPMRDVGTIRTEKAEVQALALKEVQELRAKLHLDDDALSRDVPDGVDYMLGTGARIGEALACRWTDLIGLDSDDPRVDIHATVIWVKGVGTIIQESPKTSASNRIAHLPDFTAEMLRRRRDNPRHDDLVFPSHRGKVRDPNNFRKGWDAFRDRKGYEWVHPHIFRKTAATIVEDPVLAGAVLGHTPGSRVTERDYIKRSRLTPDVRGKLNAIGNPPADIQRNETGSDQIQADSIGEKAA